MSFCEGLKNADGARKGNSTLFRGSVPSSSSSSSSCHLSQLWHFRKMHHANNFLHPPPSLSSLSPRLFSWNRGRRCRRVRRTRLPKKEWEEKRPLSTHSIPPPLSLSLFEESRRLRFLPNRSLPPSFDAGRTAGRGAINCLRRDKRNFYGSLLSSAAAAMKASFFGVGTLRKPWRNTSLTARRKYFKVRNK